MLINIAIEDMKYPKQILLRKNILSCLKQMSAVSEGYNLIIKYFVILNNLLEYECYRE
jgi:hypothetical protein